MQIRAGVRVPQLPRVEGWLKDAGLQNKHVANVRRTPASPPDRLVQGRGLVEHVLHARHMFACHVRAMPSSLPFWGH